MSLFTTRCCLVLNSRVLLCDWHVLKAWKTNLYTKLGEKKYAELRVELMDMLCKLLYWRPRGEILDEEGTMRPHTDTDLDRMTFHKVQAFVKLMGSKEKEITGDKKFTNYFEKEWVTGDKMRRVMKAHRMYDHGGIDASSAVEGFHSSFKTRWDFKGKRNVRLDYLVTLFVKDILPAYLHDVAVKGAGLKAYSYRFNVMLDAMAAADGIKDEDVREVSNETICNSGGCFTRFKYSVPNGKETRIHGKEVDEKVIVSGEIRDDMRDEVFFNSITCSCNKGREGKLCPEKVKVSKFAPASF